MNVKALADFANFIRFIKKSKPKAKNSPIILFGGSYGGMLAFWHRLKYPFLSAGALASSAPILLFSNRYDCNSYDNQVTNNFDGYSRDCSHSIQNSWTALRQLLKTKDGREWLYKTFHLCKPLTEKDQDTFIWWIADTWRNLAMVDYANPANFIANLPAYPIGEVCEHLDQPDAPGKQLAQKVYQAISVYYNYTGELKCNNITYDLQSELGPAWDFQVTKIN